MRVTRDFNNRDDSIDYGYVDTFGGLDSLAIRCRFKSEPPDRSHTIARKPSLVDPMPNGQVRFIVSQWSREPAGQGFGLGVTGPGLLAFMVGDGAGNVGLVMSPEDLFRCHTSRNLYWTLVATWSATGEMSLYFEGIRIGHATNQTAVKCLAVPDSPLCLGAQPAGGYDAPRGLQLWEVEFFPAIVSTGRGDPQLQGGIELAPRGRPLGSMFFSGVAGSNTEDFRGPSGVISVGSANFAQNSVVNLPFPDEPVSMLGSTAGGHRLR